MSYARTLFLTTLLGFAAVSAAYAETIQLLQAVVRDRSIQYGNTSILDRAGAHRIQHRGVIRAVDARLHKDDTLDPQGLSQVKIIR